MKPAIIPPELTGKALYDFVVKNEELITHAKKSEVKKADSVSFNTMFVDDKGVLVSKAAETIMQSGATKLKAELVINTTNWFDSHMDVHIPGLWKKAISDNKGNGFYLLEAHGRKFEDVIADSCTAKTQAMSWKELGFNISGSTEALMFNAVIDKTRNEYMFGQYQKQYVKQHSVGMQYVKMITCIDDEDYPVQKENWDKYYPMVANKDDVDGIFWAILEAKIVEGSAVLFGSNSMTPAYMVEEMADSTKNQPPEGTEEKPQLNLSEAIKGFKFF